MEFGKELFKDKGIVIRRQMLEDNCAAVEKITYPHNFSDEEMEARKTSLANFDIEISELEAEKKAMQDRIKEKMKPITKNRGKLIEDIKRKYEDVTDDCFKFLDREKGMAYYYNGNGDLVKERPMCKQELQKTIYEETAVDATGTDY